MKAFVVQPGGHSFSPLLDYVDEIKFLTTGYHSNHAQLVSQIQEALQDYNPEEDVIVPVGNVTTNLIVGMQLMRKLENSDCNFFNIAYYKDKDYAIQTYTISRTEGET